MRYDEDDPEAEYKAHDRMRDLFPGQGAWVDSKRYGNDMRFMAGVLESTPHGPERRQLGWSIKSWDQAVENAYQNVCRAEERAKYRKPKKYPQGPWEQAEMDLDDLPGMGREDGA